MAQKTIGVMAAVILTVAAAVISGQKAGPAEVAVKMSGSWKLNRQLSPSVAGPARGRSGPGGADAPRMATGMALPLAGQRGGGGRGGSGGGSEGPTTPGDLPPDVVAAQGAIRTLQQVADALTVKATSDSVTFFDPRGEWTFAIDNKAAKLDVNGAKIEVKTKWDKLALRQEFATAQTRLVRTWEADDEGHLVLKVRMESMTMSSKEVKAVYDKQ